MIKHRGDAPGLLHLRQHEDAERRADLGGRRRKAAGGGADAGRKQFGRQREGGGVGAGIHGEVEQDEAGEHDRDVRGGAAAGQHRGQQDQHAERHAGKSDDLHVDAAEARHRPQPDEEADQEKQIDRRGALRRR